MKHHNTLTDDQIHNSKGFEPARKNSVSIKNSQGLVEWTTSNYTTNVIITVRESVGGDLHHRFFCLYSDNNTKKYAVYIDLNGGAALSTPATYNGVIRVDCTGFGSSGGVNIASKNQVGSQLQLALDAHPHFTALDNNLGVVTIVQVKTSTPAKDVDTGFVFSHVDTENGSEVLTTNSNGDITFISKSALSSEIEDVEGTEVKSTGESGGTKFLREDGDGTCSWQTVVGGVSGIVAGTNVTISPASGLGNVTVNSSGGKPEMTTSFKGCCVIDVEVPKRGQKAVVPNGYMTNGECTAGRSMHSLRLTEYANNILATVVSGVNGSVTAITGTELNVGWNGVITGTGKGTFVLAKMSPCEATLGEGNTTNIKTILTVNFDLTGESPLSCFMNNASFTDGVLKPNDLIIPIIIPLISTNIVYTSTLRTKQQ